MKFSYYWYIFKKMNFDITKKSYFLPGLSCSLAVQLSLPLRHVMCVTSYFLLTVALLPVYLQVWLSW